MSPVSLERPFGVEIEVNHLWYGYFLPIDDGVVPPYRIPDKLKEDFEKAGLPIGNREDTWRLEEEHSVRGRGAVEVVSPHIQGASGLEDVKRVMEILRDHGAYVNGTCGLHVHHDASDFGCRELRNLLELMVLWEPRIFDAVPDNEKRMEVSCRPLSQEVLELVRGCSYTECADVRCLQDIWYAQEENSPDKIRYNETRYHGLNLHSFWFRGTVEFRHMRGTLAGETAERWILFTHSLMETARSGFEDAGKVNGSILPLFERWRESLKLLERGSL